MGLGGPKGGTFSHGSQTQPGATGARARTYWSPLLLSLPHDGRPPQLGEGRSFPQELVVEEQDPLLLSLEQGTGVNASGSAGAGWVWGGAGCQLVRARMRAQAREGAPWGSRRLR